MRMRSHATAKVAVRRLTLWRSAVSQILRSASTMILSSTHVDLVLAPEERREVLHPLEVADSDAARVADHVGDDQHVAVAEDVVGLGQGRPVGAFEDELGLDALRALGRDLLFERGGDEDVAVDVPERLIPSRRAASRPVTKTPRPVALTRPSEPPRCKGLPVTTPVPVVPVFIEYVSIIQAMTGTLVFTSGAGMLRCGPMMMPISLVSARAP
jgi:hypothetical protein